MATLAVAAGAPVRPQLVIGIVVDGLEQDYIDLLRDSFGKGGFNRLLSDGVVIPALDYGTPLDAAGATAVLVSGATADISGISAATRFDREALRTVPSSTTPPRWATTPTKLTRRQPWPSAP